MSAEEDKRALVAAEALLRQQQRQTETLGASLEAQQQRAEAAEGLLIAARRVSEIARKQRLRAEAAEALVADLQEQLRSVAAEALKSANEEAAAQKSVADWERQVRDLALTCGWPGSHSSRRPWGYIQRAIEEVVQLRSALESAKAQIAAQDLRIIGQRSEIGNLKHDAEVARQETGHYRERLGVYAGLGAIERMQAEIAQLRSERAEAVAALAEIHQFVSCDTLEYQGKRCDPPCVHCIADAALARLTAGETAKETRNSALSSDFAAFC